MSNQAKGIALAACGSSLWGISGILAQLLFEAYTVSPEWLVSCRLLLSGILILVYSGFIKREAIFSILSRRDDLIQLFLFSLFGMMACQYLFFKTVALSGAALATVLQFTAPILVYFYLVFRKVKKADVKEFIFVILTFIGVFLLVTNGRINQLNVSLTGLVFGIGSAFAVAFYSLQPAKLLEKYGSPMIVGWAMLIGGVLFQFIYPITHLRFQLNFTNSLFLGLIIVFGTAVAFLAFLSSLTYINASLASVLTAIEPLMAAVLSAVVFLNSLKFFEIIGLFLVLGSVLLLGRENQTKAN